LSVTCDKSMVYSGYSGFLRHDITVVESGVKHHNPIPIDKRNIPKI
jgi:hypothetical protein